MARTARFAALTGSALLLLATLAVPASAASGTTTRWVDDDGRAGPNGCGGSAPAKKVIQKAVDASDANDIVLVCPGTYVGTVQVTGNRDGLLLKSTTKWGAVLMPPVLSGRIELAGVVGVRNVDDVTLQWFKIVFPTTTDGCRFWPAGAGAINADRIAIRGLLVRAQGQKTLGDCRYARGILVGDSDDALVTSNTLIDFAWTGIDMTSGTGTIHDNSIRYFHPNYDRTESGRGIQADDGRYRITNNVIRALATGGVSTPGYESGIEIREGTINGTIIRDNTVTQARFGIYVLAGDHISVLRNVLKGYAGTDGDGLYLELFDSSIRHNSASGFFYGIQIQGALGGRNTFLDNDVRGNTDLSCRDSTSGPGTSGTDNEWTDNVGDGSFPAGICGSAPF